MPGRVSSKRISADCFITCTCSGRWILRLNFRLHIMQRSDLLNEHALDSSSCLAGKARIGSELIIASIFEFLMHPKYPLSRHDVLIWKARRSLAQTTPLRSVGRQDISELSLRPMFRHIKERVSHRNPYRLSYPLLLQGFPTHDVVQIRRLRNVDDTAPKWHVNPHSVAAPPSRIDGLGSRRCLHQNQEVHSPS